MRASCQGCGTTLLRPVPDSCPVCGRTPPVVIAPDTRPEWQQSVDDRRRRAFVIVVVLLCLAGTLAFFVVWPIVFGY